MEKMIKRYYQLKQKQKETEQELTALRAEILAYCAQEAIVELEAGSYKVRIVSQERKDYDDHKLYEALPDPALWRMLSKVDAAKVAGLIKLNVIHAENIKEACTVKTIKMLQVEKK